MDLTPFRPLHTAACKMQCSSCNLREICLPVGLTRSELDIVDARLVTTRRKVARGETLFHAGDRFDAVFAVRTGFFKLLTTSSQGREQITGFRTSGELLGMDGIASDRHGTDAIALEDSQVCVIPYAELQTLTQELPSLQTQFYKLMSHEIVTDHEVMFMLGSMYAEERVAAFLLNLMHRMEVRGFSPSSVLLRMSREEIGNFLGLKLETVSRTLSKFQANGLLVARLRQIEIVAAAGLQKILDASAR